MRLVLTCIAGALLLGASCHRPVCRPRAAPPAGLPIASAGAQPAPRAVTEHHYAGDLLLTRLETPSEEALRAAAAEVVRRVREDVDAGLEVRATRGTLVVRAPPDVHRQVTAVLLDLRAEAAAGYPSPPQGDAPSAFSTRVHDVADLLRVLPAVELVGPEGAQRLAQEEVLLAAVHEQLVLLLGEAGPGLRLRGTTLTVRATERVHGQVDDVLRGMRERLAGSASR